MKKYRFISTLLIGSLCLSSLAILAYQPKVSKKSKPKPRYTLKTVPINARHVKFNVPDPIWGLDISHHNGNINWSIIEGKRKPDFLYIKATEGATHHDHKYKEHLKKSKERSILVGSYHFFSYSSSGERQARNFYRFAKVQAGDLRPVLDLEYRRRRKRMPKDKEVIDEIKAFITEYKALSGIEPIIYCTQLYYEQYINKIEGYTFDLWIADYRGERPKIDCIIWQKTDQFLHPSFKGKVDYNVFHGTSKELEALVLK